MNIGVEAYLLREFTEHPIPLTSSLTNRTCSCSLLYSSAWRFAFGDVVAGSVRAPESYHRQTRPCLRAQRALQLLPPQAEAQARPRIQARPRRPEHRPRSLRLRRRTRLVCCTSETPGL